MFKRLGIGLLTISMLISTICVAGCDSAAKSGALIGAGGGALAGQAIGHNTEGTLIGAGVGAIGGYIIGNEMDKSAEKKQQATAPAQTQPYSASSTDSNTVTIWLNNANGSQTPVKLIKNADGSYTGPKGERYSTMPTEQQLKQAYGI